MVKLHRSVTEGMKSELVEELGNCRDAIVKFASKAPINGPEYNAEDTMRRALDDMVEVITGKREHFWAKDHAMRNYHKSCDEKHS